MNKFNIDVFETLVNDLLNDTFYVNGRSERGKIATIRQYTEVIIRRILDFSNEEYVTLGDKKVLKQLRIRSNNNSMLMDAIENIHNDGNGCTHTQKTEKVTEEQVNSSINSLFDLYAYLLIDYFKKYNFGTNASVIRSFSMLPPIIRYLVLNDLYKEYPDNIFVIDKLSLAILKAFDKETAIKWLDEKKDILVSLKSVTKEGEVNLYNQYGKELADSIILSAPNIYNMCMNRIEIVSMDIEKNGKVYNDFEGALIYYNQYGKVDGETAEVLEFNSIMEFLYLGRKSKKIN